MKMLKFPNDRHNGYVLHTGADGQFFVPEFSRVQTNPLNYCQAFMELGRRLDREAALEKEKV